MARYTTGASYIICRNRNKRPTLMHRIGVHYNTTLCGLDATFWSISWHVKPIEIMLCQRCKRLGG